MTIFTLLSLLCLGALVNGPQFSLEATGQLGKALVYATWKGRAYVRQYVVPANPRSLAQQFQRAILSAVSRWWGGIGAVGRDTWTTLASLGNYSTFNAFCKSNLDNETESDTLYARADQNGAGANGTVLAVTATGGLNYIDLSVTLTDPQISTDLMMVSLGTAGGIATTANNIQRTIASRGNYNAGDAFTVRLNDIPAGVYHLSARVMGEDGFPSSWVNTAVAATVTGTA